MKYTKEGLQAIRLQVISRAELILCTGSTVEQKAIAELAKDRVRDNCEQRNVLKFFYLLHRIEINHTNN